MISNRNKLNKVLIIYSIILFAVWAAYELLLVPHIKAGVSEQTFRILDSNVIKPAVWMLPAILLIRHFNAEVSVPLNEMFGIRRGWKVLLSAFVLITAYLCFMAWRKFGSISIHGSIPFSILIYTFVGFCEEIVFRGWLFNATVKEERPEPAYAINAAMFLLIHFPKWIADGILVKQILSGSALLLLMLSLLLAWSFRKSRSIIVPAFLHFWWDLLVSLLL